MALKGTIAFSSGRTADYDIWTLSLESGELKQLTFGSENNDHPRFSPDGSMIVYSSAPAGGIQQLCLMTREGKEKRQLTKGDVYHSYPAWSPDGKRIICSANYQDKQDSEIWALSIDGSSKPERLVSYPGLETEPSFSPDGKKLLFSCAKGTNYDLWEVDLATQQWKQLTTHEGKDFCPAYSPDGQWIAFISRPSLDEDGEIWLMHADGRGTPRQLTDNKVSDHHIRWSPNSSSLIYCSSGKTPGTSRLRVLSIKEDSDFEVAFDRSPLEGEIGAKVLNSALFEKMAPNFMKKLFEQSKRLFVDENFWGQERNPDWGK